MSPQVTPESEKTSPGYMAVALSIVCPLGVLFRYDFGATSLGLWRLTVLLWLLLLCLFIRAVIRRWIRGVWGYSRRTVLLMALFGPGLVVLFAPLDWIAATHKLLRNESEYTLLVERALAGELVVPGVYMVEEEPPRWVLITLSHSWMMGMYGVVYFESDETEAEPVLEAAYKPGDLFDGCFPIYGRWYLLKIKW